MSFADAKKIAANNHDEISMHCQKILTSYPALFLEKGAENWQDPMAC